jgi:clan AA aspartic protease (TIGR02281 family)
LRYFTLLLSHKSDERALDKAYSAISISQSAQSSDDWNLVVSQWSNAIALMKAVPATNPNKALAQTKIAEYQRNLTYAKQQATRRIQQKPDSVVDFVPEMPPSPLRASRTAAVEALPPMQSNQTVLQAKIKRHASGTPVINVTFNGTQQFEMIVDTGASGTVITQPMAAALGVVAVAKAKANTASAKAVEFPIGYINSLEVGGAVVKNVPVAIAPSPELEIGLLGHDFFGNYDVTIKRDVVEFHPR